MTGTALIALTFEANAVRVIDRDGDPWFVATDVAAILGYRDAEKLTRMLDEDEKGTHNVGTLGGPQDLTVISESGLYNATFRSRRPEAQRLRKWVTAEVLPALRRTGHYGRTNQRVMSVREVLATFDRLKASTDPAERRYLYGMLREDSIQFSLPLPELHEISATENVQRLHGKNIATFWQAYDALIAEHGTAAINRHRNPDRVAINLPDFERRCRDAGIDLPFITDLRAALSADPRFVARAVVNTPERKSVNCWVFRAG